MREALTSLVQRLEAHDELEQAHIEVVQAWIGSGAQLYRVAKPDRPPQHLVSYFVLVDVDAERLLLVDHKLSGLWLPGGGHVEPGEEPWETAVRELHEELGLAARFVWRDPLFLTVTQTVGTTRRHTDVSLWYVLAGSATDPVEWHCDEFAAVRWLAFDDIPWERTDPHMRRFVMKLRAALGRDSVESRG